MVSFLRITNHFGVTELHHRHFAGRQLHNRWHSPKNLHFPKTILIHKSFSTHLKYLLKMPNFIFKPKSTEILGGKIFPMISNFNWPPSTNTSLSGRAGRVMRRQVHTCWLCLGQQCGYLAAEWQRTGWHLWYVLTYYARTRQLVNRQTEALLISHRKSERQGQWHLSRQLFMTLYGELHLRRPNGKWMVEISERRNVLGKKVNFVTSYGANSDVGLASGLLLSNGSASDESVCGEVAMKRREGGGMWNARPISQE